MTAVGRHRHGTQSRAQVYALTTAAAHQDIPSYISVIPCPLWCF